MQNISVAKLFIAIALAITLHLFCAQRESFVATRASENITTTTFLIYASSMAQFVSQNPTFQGTLPGNNYIPSWLSPRDDISRVMVNGHGYVFMPNKPGMQSLLIEKTTASHNLGYTTDSQIVTPSGAITKPAFIPSNYVVYIL